MNRYLTVPSVDMQQYWVLQVLGWSLYATTAFICGPLWYGFQHIFWDPMVIVIQSLSGLLISLPLARVFLNSLRWKMSTRIIVSGVVIILAASLWTLMRLMTYQALMPGGEHMNIWQEFGGWLYISFIVFICWSALYYGSVYFKLNEAEIENSHRIAMESNISKIREQALQTKAREAQLRMLRYQLNPHFLYNTLNSINALVQLNNNEKAQNMIQQLSGFLRHTLDDDSIDRVKFSQEIDNIMRYLEIEKARFDEALVIKLEISDQAQDAMLPGLILQPLIENAIKYAIAESETGGVIKIEAKVLSEFLAITVSDSGPGMSNPDSTDGRGVGIRNVRERLQTQYGDSFELTMQNIDTGGLSVQISIPMETATGAWMTCV